MARLLIAGGVLFDGVADTLRRADVLIEGDAIVEVGPELSGEAMRIDASGKWVVPGFIDKDPDSLIKLRTSRMPPCFWPPSRRPRIRSSCG